MAADQLESLKVNNYTLRPLTATEKHYTFLVNDEIWLGRLKKETIDLIISRSKLLKSWDAKFIQYPIATEDESWMVFPNFTSEYQINEQRSLLKDNKNEGKYWVAFFDSVAPQNEICNSELWIYKENAVAGYNPKDLLETYVLLWLLNVGDHVYNNTYVDTVKKKLYIMDYSTNRNKGDQDTYFYFSKPPADKCKWFQQMGRYYKDVADSIDRIIDISPEYTERIQYAQSLLDKYYNDWETQFGHIPSLSSNLFPTATPKVPILGNIGVPRGGSKDAPFSMGSLMSALPSATIPSQFSSRGQMSSKLGGGTTYSGYSFNDMKIYLQKYIQAGMVDKARQAGVELYRIRELEDSSAKGNFTSFINTLKIIAAEDIGVADFNMSVSVIDYLNRNPGLPFEYIDGIITDLAETPKTHLSKKILRTYTQPACMMQAKRLGLPVDDSYSNEDMTFANANMNAVFFNSDDNLRLKYPALVFYKRLLDQDYNAVTWWNFFVIESKTYDKISSRDSYYDGAKWKKIAKNAPTIILWNILSNLYRDNGTGPINVLRWAYFENIKKEDSIYYALMAIIAVINKLTYTPIQMEPVEGSNELLEGNYSLVANEPFMPDKSGRKGAIQKVELQPENMNFHIQIFSDIAQYC